MMDHQNRGSADRVQKCDGGLLGYFRHVRKTNQDTTPICKTKLCETETVTVTDPRHALYGNTLPLISIEQRRDVGGGRTRYIPVEATDQALEQFSASPIPLSLKAIQQLLNTFQRIVEGDQDETLSTTICEGISAVSQNQTPVTKQSLVESDTPPAAGLHPETGNRLSGLAPTAKHRNGEPS